MNTSKMNEPTAAATFFIEYKDRPRTVIKFKTAANARKAYLLYSEEPEDDATGWGWETIFGDRKAPTSVLKESTAFTKLW